MMSERSAWPFESGAQLIPLVGASGSIAGRRSIRLRSTVRLSQRGLINRALMKCDPADAAPPFNLGNMLRLKPKRRCVPPRALIRRFAEAWYNLSDLLDEQGRSEAAIDCLRRALHAAPDYADAMFNLALLLQRGSRHKEAAECWRHYLAKDAQSEWASRARRCLKFCEMQIHLSAC
jgi:tetratricopeptide (TPR) repeat protein